MPVRAALLICLLALVVGGCRSGDEPTLGPVPEGPREPKLRMIAAGHAAQWTQDGRIVYVDSRGEDVWIIRPDGKRPRRVVRSKERLSLAVSPDRSRMLLPAKKRDLVARTDGRRVRPLAPGMEAVRPSWSDDGSMISFERLHGGKRSIWAAPAGGGPPRRIFGEFGGAILAWASDGSMIVRASQEHEGGSFHATLLFGSEGEPTELPELTDARFLPDGTVEAIDAEGSLVLMDKTGAIARRLSVSALPGHSPDGRLLVYEHDEQVWLARSDWSSPLELAKGSCSQPAFSPDGSRVVCSLTQTKGKKQGRWVAVIAIPADMR